MRHVTVLRDETVEALNLAPGKNVIDCTLGDGGHSEVILTKTAPDGRLLGIDADAESLLRAKKFLYEFGDRAVYVRDTFAHIKDIVAQQQFGPVHGIVMDLGWSSPQFEDRGRGFSFQLPDEPLDMRYNGANGHASGETAADVLNDRSVEELTRIFYEYGEEKLSREIAQAVVESRKEAPFQTVKGFVDVVLACYRKKLKTDKEIPWVGGLHPATKVFQAIRIEVNSELKALEQALPQAIEVLESGGRLAVITFHSLEDRIVKHYFKSQKDKTVRLINKKPIAPSDAEAKENTRARSAKLRIIEKI